MHRTHRRNELKRFISPDQFRPWPKTTALPIPGHQNIIVRSEAREMVYWAPTKKSKRPILAGGGLEEFELTVNGGFLFHRAEHGMWFYDKSKDQKTVRISDETFTSLDKPAPMSPEMMAIHRLQKRNEMAREQQMRQIERLHDELRSQRLVEDNGVVETPETPQTPADTTEPKRRDGSPEAYSGDQEQWGNVTPDPDPDQDGDG